VQQQQQPESSQNARVKATSSIWGCAIGMMGICIPLSAIIHAGAELPAVVIVGAAFSTAAVWAGEVVSMVLNSGNARKAVGTENKQQFDELNGRVRELEERLANVETIDRFEQHLAQKSISAGRGTPVAPVEPTTYSTGYGSEAAYQTAKHD
jgi:TolA-binding protein